MGDYKYKLSVIIPMYNAEKYIANCLDSILNSNLPRNRYEIIVVNDGSSDNGPIIAQKYASDFDYVKYLTQNNQGQSVARNYGIRSCSGEYIWCVDADDTVDKDFSALVKSLNDHKSIDILAFRLKVVTEKGNYVKHECQQTNVSHNIVLKGRDAVINGYDPSSVCALWIRRNFIIDNNLFFKEGITHQDVELSYRLFAEAKEVFFTDETPYNYILHPRSTSQSTNPQKKIKYLSDDIIVYESFMKLSEIHRSDSQLSLTIKNRAQNILFGMVMSLFIHRKQWCPLGISKAVVENLKDNGLYPLKGPFDSWKKTLFSKLLNIESLIV